MTPGGQTCPWLGATAVGLLHLWSCASQRKNFKVQKSMQTQRWRQCTDFTRTRNNLNDITCKHTKGHHSRGYNSFLHSWISWIEVLEKKNLWKRHERTGKYGFFNCFSLLCGLDSQPAFRTSMCAGHPLQPSTTLDLQEFLIQVGR